MSTVEKISISLSREAAAELARLTVTKTITRSSVLNQFLIASSQRHKDLIARKCIAAYGEKGQPAKNQLTQEERAWLDADDLEDEGW